MNDIPPFNLVETFQLAPHLQPPTAPAPGKPARGDRWRALGHWARDTGLGITGFVIVMVVAVSGWTASFIGLHSFGMTHMGLNHNTAWLVPATFDGAPLGLSLVVFRASIHGRAATIWRALIIVFTLLSSWINWQHIPDPTGRWIASFMPPAAVILFEGLMSEARAAAARRDGKQRPRLHPLRWAIDRSGTWAIYRAYVLGIELPDALKDAADKAVAEHATDTATPPLSVAPSVAVPSTETGDSNPTERATEPPASVDHGQTPTVDQTERQERPATGDRTAASTAPKQSTNRRPKTGRPGVGKKAPRRSLDEWVDLATPIFHAEFSRLRRQPTANEFATAIKSAGLGIVSDTRAKSIRAEVLDRAELPSLDGEN